MRNRTRYNDKFRAQLLVESHKPRPPSPAPKKKEGEKEGMKKNSNKQIAKMTTVFATR